MAKNTSKRIYILFLGSLLILVIALAINNRKQEKQLQITINQAKQIQSHLLALKHSVKTSHQSNEKMLRDIGVEDSKHQKYPLSEIIGKEPKLVLVTTELNCEPCVNLGIEHIRKFIENVGKEQVIVLVSYNNFRNYYLFDRTAKLSCKVYNIKEGALNLPADKLNLPYFIKINPGLKTSRVFIPVKGFDKPTDDYFKVMTKTFQSYKKTDTK